MPRGFRFNLQAVLEQRERVEEAKRRVVVELERERLAIEERIRGYQRAITSARQDMRRELGAERTDGEQSGANVSLSYVRMQAGASLNLVAKAQQAVLELAGLGRRLDAARVELLEAATRRKAVELLREKRLQEWKRAQRAKEDAELDEMSVMRYGRADTSETGAAA